MIAVDTNILIYSHRRESLFHEAAVRLVEQLVAGPSSWALPWPCVHEFISVVTNPKIFKVPTPISTSLDTVRTWHQGRNVIELAEGDGYFETLRRISLPAKLQGARIHDARIAALCIYHGVDELWSADRDFSLFTDLRVRNPLVGATP